LYGFIVLGRAGSRLDAFPPLPFLPLLPQLRAEDWR
jgi:hypothetical protein